MIYATMFCKRFYRDWVRTRVELVPVRSTNRSATAVRLLFEINLKMVNTNGFRFDLIRFLKDFFIKNNSLCVEFPRRGMEKNEIFACA